LLHKQNEEYFSSDITGRYRWKNTASQENGQEAILIPDNVGMNI
jgi:hypothetical protein